MSISSWHLNRQTLSRGSVDVVLGLQATRVMQVISKTILLLPVALALLNTSLFADDIPDFHKTLQPFFNSYCVKCHGANREEGDVRLDQFTPEIESIEHAQILQYALDALNSADMPPEDEKQPSAKVLEPVLKSLYSSVSRAEDKFSGSSTYSTRRKNRREFINTLNDLFGVRLNLGEAPSDRTGEGFDTNVDLLETTTAHIEGYQVCATKVLQQLLVLNQAPGDFKVAVKYGRAPTKQRYLVNKIGQSSPYMYPGRYELELHAWIENYDPQEPPIYMHDKWTVGKAYRIFGTKDAPQVIRIPYVDHVAAGAPKVFMAEPILSGQSTSDEERLERLRKIAEGDPTVPYLVVVPKSMTARIDNRVSRQIFGDLSAYRLPSYAVPRNKRAENAKKPTPPNSLANAMFSGLLAVMYPQGIPSESIHRDMQALFLAAREDQLDFWDAAMEVMAIAMTSPHFLYSAEADGEDLSDFELANRLSHFLWSSVPDEELRAVAKAGKLATPEVYSQQFTRMLADPKSDRLIRSFGAQWLELDRLDQTAINEHLFPRWQDSVKVSMKEEILLFIKAIVDENLPVDHLIESDFSVVDNVMAAYYGLPVRKDKGNGFYKINLGDQSKHYGGLLTKPGILALTSNGTRTSPVERGAFVLRKFLNDPPPPPPPNIPLIDEKPTDDLTAKEMLAAHSKVAQCASCHRKMDSLGFALEAFDPVGKLRTAEARLNGLNEVEEFKGKGKARRKIIVLVPEIGFSEIDTTGTLPDGASLDGHLDLKNFMLTRKDDLARGVTKALLSYAIGRQAGFADKEAIEHIVAESRKDNYRVRDILYGIVTSPVFLSK